MPRRQALVESLHLMALGGFALAQPIYELLGKEPAFFVVRGSQPTDLLLLGLSLSIVVPGILACLPLLASLIGEQSRQLVHGLVLALWVGLAAMPPLKRTISGETSDPVYLSVALGLGLLAWLLYRKLAAIRLFLSALSPVVVIFPLLFLLSGPIARIAFPSKVAALQAEVPEQTRAPVFVLVFDALPVNSLLDSQHQIDSDRFPAFGRLAREGTWYSNATTVAGLTTYAVPAILSGQYPDFDKQPLLANYPGNLFTMLGSTYEVQSIEPITRLCPPSTCGEQIPPTQVRWRELKNDVSVLYGHTVSPPELSRKLPPITDQWGGFVARHQGVTGRERRARKLQDFESVLSSVDERDRRLYFVHVLWPHAPYQFLPTGTFYTEQSEEKPRVWGEDPWPPVMSWQRHLLQVGFVDYLLGRLLDRLDQLGIYDESLIAVVADHGVSFRPGGYRRAITEDNLGDILPVPLLIKAPGQRVGGKDSRQAETVDLLPTLAEILGVSLPYEVDGVSLLQPAQTQREEKTYIAGRMTTAPVSAVMEDQQASVRRKLELFGEGAWEGGMVHPPLARELLGNEVVGQLSSQQHPDLQLTVQDLEYYQNLQLEEGYAPSLIRGWIRSDGEPAGDLDVAVAVNGVVRAVTRAVRSSPKRELYTWSAMVEEGAFRDGANRVEAFLVVEDGGRPALGPLGNDSERTEPFMDIPLGAEPYPGLLRTGFFATESINGVPIAWTHGRSKLQIPLYGQREPVAVRLVIPYVGPREAPLYVSVNGRGVFQGIVPQEGLDVVLPLRDIRVGRWATIRMYAETFVPSETMPGSEDDRHLGVALAGLWLLSEMPEGVQPAVSPSADDPQP